MLTVSPGELFAIFSMGRVEVDTKHLSVEDLKHIVKFGKRRTAVVKPLETVEASTYLQDVAYMYLHVHNQLELAKASVKQEWTVHSSLCLLHIYKRCLGGVRVFGGSERFYDGALGTFYPGPIPEATVIRIIQSEVRRRFNAVLDLQKTVDLVAYLLIESDRRWANPVTTRQHIVKGFAVISGVIYKYLQDYELEQK